MASSSYPIDSSQSRFWTLPGSSSSDESSSLSRPAQGSLARASRGQVPLDQRLI